MLARDRAERGRGRARGRARGDHRADRGQDFAPTYAEAIQEYGRAIERNPGAFYVNIHNAQFPPGAIRGQLEAQD